MFFAYLFWIVLAGTFIIRAMIHPQSQAAALGARGRVLAVGLSLAALCLILSGATG